MRVSDDRNRPPAAPDDGRISWTETVTSKVLAAVIVALLLWVGSAQVSQIRAQTRTAEQVRSLTHQIKYLRESLADVPKIRDRVSRLEVTQNSLERRISRLDGRGP